MKLIVTGRHVATTDTTRQLIRRKLKRFERVLNDSAVSAQFVLSRERLGFQCELTVHARGDHMLHAVARHARLSTAITGAADKVGQQAQRLADRWKTRRKVAG